MIFPQLKKLKKDIEKTQHFIRRLEKDGDEEKIPFYNMKLSKLQDAADKIELMIKARA